MLIRIYNSILIFSIIFFYSFAHGAIVGPIEITPVNATLVLQKFDLNISLFPTFRFNLKNKSSSDVKIILISTSINAYDNLNQKLIKDGGAITSSGIPLSRSNIDINQNDRIFVEDKGNFITLSPGQEIQAFIDTKWQESVYDVSGEFITTHRPSKVTFNGSVGIINIDGSNSIRAFSITEFPISTTVR